MKRKIFGLILFAALALTCAFTMPTEAKAASVSDLTFELNEDGNSYCIVDCSDNAQGDLFITPTYNGKPVTGIAYEAFHNCMGLTKVTIPDSITSIGMSAFNRCTGLTEITIPDSVTNIEKYAFSWCDNLKGIWVDDQNSYYCSDNNGVLFTKDMTTLVAFPSALKSYTIPNSVTTIGDDAFNCCINLTDLTIGNNVTCIGEGAFFNCTGLTEITIPDSVTDIGYLAFSRCSGLTTVYLGVGVTHISRFAFDEYTSVETLHYMGDEARFAEINIEEGNNKLLSAERIYHNVTVAEPEEPAEEENSNKKDRDDDDDVDMTIVIVAVAAVVIVMIVAVTTVVALLIVKKKKQ